jgi:hypothetical protein
VVSLLQTIPPKPCILFFSHAYHIPCPPHSPWFNCLMVSGDEYKSWSSPLCNLLHSIFTSSLSGPSIRLSTLFSNTHTLGSFLNVTDQVSRPYKTNGRIVVLYIWTCKFLGSRREDRRPDRVVGSSPRI